MEFEVNPKKFFVKDKELECPYCGEKNSIRELIEDGEFDEMSFDEDCDPFGFNPFDDPNRKGHGTDRITIPFNCHCKKCERYLSVCLVTKIFAYDIFDDDYNTVTSEYTEER